MNAAAREIAVEPDILDTPKKVADVFRARMRRLVWLRSEPTRIAELTAYYRTHIADFISDWAITYDPRNVRKGLPVVLPFVLDRRQREWVEFAYRNWRDAAYGGTEKSRDVGLSWLMIAFSIALCVLFENMACGWGSFSGIKVDRRGDMGSLFEKGRTLAGALPREFSGGYDEKTCAPEMRLLFPWSGSSVTGEIGDNIGRGGRTGIYFVDETAHLEHDQLIDAALSKTTDCRQDISSVFGMRNSFAERMHDGKSRKFTFHWRENPRFTEADYVAFLEQWGPVITAQELDINYQASVEGVVIPSEWVNAAIDAHVKLGINPTGERLLALDVADQGIDKNAAAVRHGILIEHLEQWSGQGSDTFATAERAFLLCDVHRCPTLVFDADGLGAGVRGDGRKLNESRSTKVAVKPFRGSAGVVDPSREMVEGRKNEDFFANRKAQAWWALRRRFELTHRAIQGLRGYDPDSLISIASGMRERATLCVELSQPTYSQNNAGKLLIDKQPDDRPSPNLADAVMMAMSPPSEARSWFG